MTRKPVLHGFDERGQGRAIYAGPTHVLPGLDGETRSRDLSQWYTPPKLAKRIVAWSLARDGDCVLEPSAGQGALVKPLLERGCHVDAWEIDPGNAAALGELAHAGLTVCEADFLASPGWGCSFRYDLAMLNPPYEDNQDVCDRLAILSERPRFGGEHSAKTDFVVLEVTRRTAARKQGEATPAMVEWWT
jgi:Dimethyladenosine transferase (rRNA methylation)